MFCFDYGVVMYSKKQNQAAFVANEDIATKGPNAFARWNSTTNKIEMLEPIEREYVAIPSDSHFLDPLRNGCILLPISGFHRERIQRYGSRKTEEEAGTRCKEG